MKALFTVLGWIVSIFALALAAFWIWYSFAPADAVAHAMDMSYGGYNLVFRNRVVLAFFNWLFLAPLTFGIVFNPLVFPRLPWAKSSLSRFFVAVGFSVVALVVGAVAGEALAGQSFEKKISDAVRQSDSEDEGERAKARLVLEKGAEKGSYNAAFILAEMYAKDDKTPADVRRTYALYKRLYSDSITNDEFRREIIHNLVVISGRVVVQDPKLAFEIVKDMADREEPDAYNALGARYHSGQGVDRDYGQAMKYFRLAAEEASTGEQRLAMNNIATMYRYGDGVTQDSAAAEEWTKRAAQLPN